MATLTTHVVPHAGVVLASGDFAAATSGAGDKAATGDGVCLIVKNGSGSAVTVTLAVPEVIDAALTVASRTVSVAAGGEGYIPLPALYQQPSDQLAHITYSSVTTVTVAVIRVP